MTNNMTITFVSSLEENYKEKVKNIILYLNRTGVNWTMDDWMLNNVTGTRFVYFHRDLSVRDTVNEIVGITTTGGIVLTN